MIEVKSATMNYAETGQYSHTFKYFRVRTGLRQAKDVCTSQNRRKLLVDSSLQKSDVESPPLLRVG
jgi:hypothetical protein